MYFKSNQVYTAGHWLAREIESIPDDSMLSGFHSAGPQYPYLTTGDVEHSELYLTGSIQVQP